MRTKTLLLTAALSIAAAATSMAQAVYSVNIVGYVNQQIPQGFSMAACQLKGNPDNKVVNLLGTPPNGTFVFKFDAAAGGYITIDYIGGWEGDDLDMTLSPGEGVFIQAPTAFTSTFVGEVLTGTLTTPIASGFSVVSSKIPMAGRLQTDLGYVPTNGDFIFQFDPATGGYIINDYIGGWEGDNNGEEPNIKIGEPFFIQHPGAASVWTKVFNP